MRTSPPSRRGSSKDKFEAAVADLDSKIDHLNSDETYIGLDRLANLIGDGHTYVEFPKDNANLPLDIRHFGNDSRVATVAPGYEQALGTRVLAEMGSRFYAPPALGTARQCGPLSTRYYKFADGTQNVVAPDKEIIPTWDDYKNGRDKILAWVLALK